MITLSEKAHSKLKTIVEERGTDAALRIYVTGGGCSGLSYGLSLDAPRENDHRFTQDGIDIVVDPNSLPFVKGSQVDYKEALMGGGFTIINPNAVRTCGCGSSFRTATATGTPEVCD